MKSLRGKTLLRVIDGVFVKATVRFSVGSFALMLVFYSLLSHIDVIISWQNLGFTAPIVA